jgi:hypothetical protein
MVSASQSLSFVDKGWALLDTHSIGYFPSTLVASVPFAPFFLAPQMFVKVTSSSFIKINVPVKPII